MFRREYAWLCMSGGTWRCSDKSNDVQDWEVVGNSRGFFVKTDDTCSLFHCLTSGNSNN